jgi:cell division protein FtsL
MHGAYAIHRPVVNRRLVRDRDRRWARELGLIVAAAVPILLTLLTSIWLRSEVLSTGYRTHELEQQLRAIEQVERRLQLESAYLASPERVERRATTELHMVTPSPRQLIYVEELE